MPGRVPVVWSFGSSMIMKFGSSPVVLEFLQLVDELRGAMDVGHDARESRSPWGKGTVSSVLMSAVARTSIMPVPSTKSR